MDNSTLFFTPLHDVNFLPLFQYLNVLGGIFYSEKSLKNENKTEPFLIINAFYEHLNRSRNETEAKRKLVQKCLEGSDLYGGLENETLDMEYVNKTLDYIVSNVVFSQTGNLYGYLAEIVRSSPTLKLTLFKKTVFEHLSYLRHLNDDGDVSKLTELAIIKIAESLIWPLFPNPTHDMEIISVKYIYALAGYNFAQSAQMNLSDVSFQKCAIIAMTLEASVIGGKLPNSTLQIFALPAMIYYAHKETAKFNQQSAKHLIKDEDFWSDAFFTLFAYLNTTLETIRQEMLKTDSIYQFHQVMLTFKNRTSVARDVLHKECSYLNETYLESLIDDYKTYSGSTRCHPRARLLPNLELVYSAQFYSIKEKYRLMETDFIQSAFDEFPVLRNLINSTQIVVYKSGPEVGECYFCVPLPPKYKPNINFFAINNQGQFEYFALEQNENNVTLLIYENNKTEFNRRVGLPQETKLDVGPIPIFLKRRGENFDIFVNKIAEMKAEEFRQQLFEYGYDKTSMEKFFEIITAFIPFYHCVKYANAGQRGMAALSCLGDVLGFIPFAGLMNVGFKISTTVANRFLIASALTLRTFTIRQAILLILTTGLQDVAKHLSMIFIKVVFTKQMFKTISMAVLRAIDPGCELLGKLVWHGSAMTGKVLKTTLKHLVNKFRLLKFKIAKFESIWQHLMLRGVKPADGLDMISIPGKIDGREVYRLIYPGGGNPFGPKCIYLSNGHAELRKIIGFKEASPVVISRISKRGKVFYRKVNLQTEESYGLELKLNKHGQLENIRQPFRKHMFKIKKEGFGGRGALMAIRDDSISRAAQLVADGKFGIGKRRAEMTMKHYVLAVDHPRSLDDLSDFNVELVNFGDFEMQDLLNEHLMVIDEPLVVDPTLKKYLPVPTYYDFALDWIRTQHIDHIYDKFQVTNARELETLMYNPEIMIDKNYNIKKMKTAIVKIYGSNFYDKTQVDLVNARSLYIERQLFRHMRLQDYYALLIWEKRGFKNVEPGIISKQIQKALYRLAVRQAAGESGALSKILFQIEVRSPLPTEHHLSELNNLIDDSKSIWLLTTEEEVCKELLKRDIYGDLTSGGTTQIFMYEMHIDSYLAVDLNGIISSKDKFVILPDMPYVIRRAEKRKVVGSEVNYIVLHSLPVVKEEAIAKLMNEIKKPGVLIG